MCAFGLSLLNLKVFIFAHEIVLDAGYCLRAQLPPGAASAVLPHGEYDLARGTRCSSSSTRARSLDSLPRGAMGPAMGPAGPGRGGALYQISYIIRLVRGHIQSVLSKSVCLWFASPFAL